MRITEHYGAPGDWEERYRRIRPQFVGKPRTAVPGHRHDYPFSLTTDHLAWLGAAGFEAPDMPWRTFYTALLVGQKPVPWPWSIGHAISRALIRGRR